MTVLRLKSKGAAVRQLQTDLNTAGASPKLAVDGDFGPATDRAVRAFQTKVGLVVDGIVGTQTRTALARTISGIATSAKKEPDKSAILWPAQPTAPAAATAAPPPNAASLRLLDTTRKIDTIFIHCAATPEGKDFTTTDIRAWHKARGFTDVGYHYVVYRDGTVALGRPIGQVGAHVSGHNTGSIGVCYIGGVSADGKVAKDTRTKAQTSSLLWLTQQLVKKFNVKRIRGHSEVANKACPSFNVQTDPLGKLV